MNMWALNKLKLAALVTLFFAITVSACKKEKIYTYNVNAVTAKKNSGNKSAQKNATEFISIAYSDLFGNTISSDKLVTLNSSYSAFADKKLIEDVIVRNFFNAPTPLLGTTAVMRNDPKTFITQAYKTLLVREPTEYEVQYLTSYITANATLTAQMFYYSLLTSNEYRYY
ncbi:MAG: hypothetical protein ABL940_00765 [Bacteroidia bacterium]